MTFEEVWKGKVEADFRSKPLYVIGRTELLANKRAAGRAKDLADVASLESLARGRRRTSKKRKRK